MFTTIVMILVIVWAVKTIAKELDLGGLLKKDNKKIEEE